MDRRTVVLRGLAAGAVALSHGSPVFSKPDNPGQLLDLAETLEKSFEYLPPAKVVEVTKQALSWGRVILRDTLPGFKDRSVAAEACGVLGELQADALWGVGNRTGAWQSRSTAVQLLKHGSNPVRVLHSVSQQVAAEVLNDRPTNALSIVSVGRIFAQDNGLTMHPTFARLLVSGQVRALIAVGEYGRAYDSLCQAVDIMNRAPNPKHVGRHHTGESPAVFSVSVSTRYNELAARDSTYSDTDREQATSYALSAMPHVDSAQLSEQRSYVRINLARSVLPESVEAATDLLLSSADISQDRPYSDVLTRYQEVARQVADKDIKLGRVLADRMREWHGPTGTTRRFMK